MMIASTRSGGLSTTIWLPTAMLTMASTVPAPSAR